MGWSISVAQNLSVTSELGATTVTADGRPLLVYQHDPRPNKAYVARWYSPAGLQVLRDSPDDHVHHHALMYALSLGGVDFWGEVPLETSGRQHSLQLSSASKTSSSGPGTATIEQHLVWRAPDGAALAQERRTITASINQLPGTSLLTWEFELAAAAGREAVELGGAHYVGLGMRLAESMDSQSKFLFPAGAEGEVVRGRERLTPATWCAIQGQVDGKPVTIAMFDAPTNVRPVRWFTMDAPFAYLSATLNLHRQPLRVESGHPLPMRYGVALWDGSVGRERIEAAYHFWRQLP